MARYKVGKQIQRAHTRMVCYMASLYEQTLAIKYDHHRWVFSKNYVISFFFLAIRID